MGIISTLSELYDLKKLASKKIDDNDIQAATRLLGKTKSISSMAAKHILEYPVLISEDASEYETALKLSKYIEVKCAEFIILASGLSPVLNVDKYNVSSHIGALGFNFGDNTQSTNSLHVDMTEGKCSYEHMSDIIMTYDQIAERKYYKSTNTIDIYGREAKGSGKSSSGNSKKSFDRIDELYNKLSKLNGSIDQKIKKFNGYEQTDQYSTDIERRNQLEKEIANENSTLKFEIKTEKSNRRFDKIEKLQTILHNHDEEVRKREDAKRRLRYEEEDRAYKKQERDEDRAEKRAEAERRRIDMEERKEIEAQLREEQRLLKEEEDIRKKQTRLENVIQSNMGTMRDTNLNLEKLDKQGPTIFDIKVRLTNEGGNISETPFTIPIAVKARLHYASHTEMVAFIEDLNVNSKNMFNFFKWTSGEISFIRDFALRMNTVSRDVSLAKRLGNHPFFRRLMDAKNKVAYKNLLRFVPGQKKYLSSSEIMPSCTLIMSKSEIEEATKLKMSHLINSRKHITKIMNDLMLLGLGIYDITNDIVHFYFSGMPDPEIIQVSKLGSDGDGNSQLMSQLIKMNLKR